MNSMVIHLYTQRNTTSELKPQHYSFQLQEVNEQRVTAKTSLYYTALTTETFQKLREGRCTHTLDPEV